MLPFRRLALGLVAAVALPSETSAANEDAAAPEIARPAETAPAAFPEWTGLLPPSARQQVPPLPAIAPAEGPRTERLEDPAFPDRWVEVEYTVDPALEARIARSLSDAGVSLGHAIVLDPASGAVLAYVATDPVRFPATRPYPTASLMKVVTAGAMLRHVPEAAGRPCRYLGSPYELRASLLQAPRVGGRSISFDRAMATSNNQCFARLAVHDLGRKTLLEELSHLGLLDPPAPGHPGGELHTPAGPLELGYLGSGLGGSFVTPLAAARLAAALASGQRVRPYWIAAVRDSAGGVEAAPRRSVSSRAWAPDLAARLRASLVSVTEDGTARNAFRDARGGPLLGPVRVAGKTGTLSGTDPVGRYRWFMGVAPAEAPRVAIVTLVVDGPTSASKVAASILHETFCPLGACSSTAVDSLHERLTARTRRIQEAVELARRKAAPPRPSSPPAVDAADEPELAYTRWTELDQLPRPIDATGFEFPRTLLRRRAQGEIVLLIDLNEAGEVVGAEVEASDLPEFEPFVLTTVAGWRFTPPTRQGRPVATRARLPIPIRVN